MAAGSLLKPFASLDLNKAPFRSDKSDRDAATALRETIAWLSLLIGGVVAVPSAEATDPPARGLPPHARAAVAAYEANLGTHALAAAIPAFARKYGMKCSACHLAVPLLTPFGQAFRDNGYRMKNGNDDLRANEPGYWPLFAWLWKDYQVDVDRVAGQTVQRQGGFANGAFVFGGMGSISDKVSFRMFPVIYEDGAPFAGRGWTRYNRALGTDWA